MNIENFFEKIYCVNLDERPDRWEKSKEEFKKIGLDNVIRFSAIKNSNGALGCRDSHLSIIKKSKDENLKNVLIFEDDVYFIEESIKHIENCLDQLKEINWSIFYFGATVDPNVGILTNVNKNLVRTNFAFATHAYAINSNIFDKILTEAINVPIIDVYYCQKIVKLGNSYIMNPMLAIQQEGFSNIENSRVNYNWMINHFNTVKRRGGIQ